MADLVRDHIGLGEVAWRAEAVLQIVIEAEVDVHFPIERAVERSHGGLGHPAGGIDRAREQDEGRVPILPAHLLEQRCPGVLGVGEHDRHEIGELVLLWGARRTGLGARVRRLDGARVLEQHARVDAEEPGEHEQGEQAEPARCRHRAPPGRGSSRPCRPGCGSRPGCASRRAHPCPAGPRRSHCACQAASASLPPPRSTGPDRRLIVAAAVRRRRFWFDLASTLVRPTATSETNLRMAGRSRD